MPWIVGIDEAGYGPNLGPFVMTSVACHVPAELVEANLWKVLRNAVRRHTSADTSRLLIEDSKLVYSTARGLLELEAGVLATVSPWRSGEAACLSQYVEWASPASHPELRGEPWFAGTTALPVAGEASQFAGPAIRFHRACTRKSVRWGPVRSVVLCPARFNRLLDEWGSKGAVLGHALTELLQANLALEGEDEPVVFLVDKHGGRNNYAAMLQHAIADGMVVVHEQGMRRSVYGVWGLKRPVRLVFQPRADSEHFCVALASMCSKYLRELLMLEFNRFWQRHLPELKPTAGYPGDSSRFYDEIRPTAERLGIAEQALWRRK